MINWSSISNRSLFGKFLRLPLRAIPHSIVVRIVSGPCCGMKWIAGSGTHGCWLGSYELYKQKAIEKFIKPGMVMYDVGANAGIYTLLFSKLVGSQGKVFAFEPFAENVANLLKHIRLNHLTNVTAIQVALADRSGLINFAIHPRSKAMGFITHTHTELRVPTFALDELVIHMNFPVPDLMKMDVEGSESAVLEGMQRVVSKKKTIIFIALHGGEQKRSCQNILEKSDYQLFWLNGDKVEGKLEHFPDDEIYALPI